MKERGVVLLFASFMFVACMTIRAQRRNNITARKTKPASQEHHDAPVGTHAAVPRRCNCPGLHHPEFQRAVVRTGLHELRKQVALLASKGV